MVDAPCCAVSSAARSVPSTCTRRLGEAEFRHLGAHVLYGTLDEHGDLVDRVAVFQAVLRSMMSTSDQGVPSFQGVALGSYMQDDV